MINDNCMDNKQIDTLTKKERNEVKRVEKQKAREKNIKIKKIKSWLPWILFAGLIVGGLYWMVNASQTAEENRLGEKVSIMNRDHISVGDSHDAYNSNPPTSGPHAGPARWGFSSEEILDENAIHNLEHGGIWISYKNIDDDSIEVLEKIAKQNSASVIVSPREENDTNIAVTSWGRLMRLDAVNEDLINEFIRQNKNKSPEPLAR